MNGWVVKYTKDAISDLSRLNKPDRTRIVTKIDWLKKNFDLVPHERLSGELRGFYKLRVGPYRVIYSVDYGMRVIIVHKVGHRREIYKL